MTDMINPDHYKGDRQYEPIAVIEDWGLNYRLGNALKYLSRNGRKPGEDPREGLRKAIWYIEREIAALDKPSQYVPFETSYEDVLDYYGQTVDEKEAWPQAWDDDTYDLRFTESNVFLEPKAGPAGAAGTDTIFSVNDFWMETPDYVTGWDPSLGPVEITPDEIADRLAKKDLDQFEDDEIVSTVERRGMIIGFRKDGTSCVLKNGKCV